MSEKTGDQPPPYGTETGYKGDDQGTPSQLPPGYSTPGQGYSGQGYSGQGYSGPSAPPGYPPAPQGYGQQYGYTTAAYTTAGYNTVVQPGVMQTQAAPPDHFCLAVFVTLCCFWPTGILAIMKASDARSSVARGDMTTAHSQARSAKQMINVSIGIGIASIILVAIIVGVYVGVILHNLDFD
ncbi:proline-rich transmembrane protein 1-like [Liolophura sinensis]|uniref:proline-rich transmembrane protein 1-like n=1 Tax=Liolophura sinensis TaxID=3198878 RepID=UPI00315931EF